MIIWGNHSDTQFPDVNFATIEGKPARQVINDDAFLDGEFVRVFWVLRAREVCTSCRNAKIVLRRL